MNIEKVMSTKIAVSHPGDSLSAAAQLMWEHDCGSILVVDDDEALVGIITDRDICMAGYIRGRPLHTIAISDTMSNQVFSCSAEDSLETAGQLMADNQVRRIPVVDSDSRPIGVLSLNDIARYAASSEIGDGLDHEVAHTLAAICQPWSERRLESLSA